MQRRAFILQSVSQGSLGSAVNSLYAGISEQFEIRFPKPRVSTIPISLQCCTMLLHTTVLLLRNELKGVWTMRIAAQQLRVPRSMKQVVSSVLLRRPDCICALRQTRLCARNDDEWFEQRERRNSVCDRLRRGYSRAR